MSQTCGNMNHDPECLDGELTMKFSSGDENPAEAKLDLPAGAQILDPEGNVIFESTGEPDKCKVKIPG